jgi:diaminopimelate epimerase
MRYMNSDKSLKGMGPWTVLSPAHIRRSMTAPRTPGSETFFRKMHGLGNDFVVLDARSAAISLSSDSTKAIADRRTGVGCDQILIIEPPRGGGDVFMAIRNSDGGEVASCGNGSRCIASLLLDESGKDEVILETNAGPVSARRAANNFIAVDMGPARDNWQDIPLAEQADTSHLAISEGSLHDPIAVSVGNPHMVFFVEDANLVDLNSLGPKLERHSLFPERANVEAVQVLGTAHLRMRVWERGVGITRACGTGACASLVAAARRGLSERKATVSLDGGDLEIEWRADNHVIMTGPVAETFTGILDRSLLL